MATTIRLIIEQPHVNFTVQQLKTLRALEQADLRIDLDSAEAFLRAELPGWFIYRGGNHVAVHVASGGERVLIVEERKAKRYIPTPNFGAITEAVKTARSAAYDDARSHARELTAELKRKRAFGQRAITFGFIRSRGTKVYTLNEQGRTAPWRDEPDDYTGTKRQLVALVADIIANYPDCDEVQLAGGFDMSESIDFDDYEPEVTSWEVTVWTRSEGWMA